MEAQPKRISFNSVEYFGKAFNHHKSNYECTLMKMVFHDLMSLDGKINESAVDDKRDRRDLWIYIYYLWRKNSDKPVFNLMNLVIHEAKEKLLPVASAMHFVETVNGFLIEKLKLPQYPLTKMIDSYHLAIFINRVITEYPDLSIPYREVLLRKLKEAVAQNNEQLRQAIEEADVMIAEAKNKMQPSSQLFIQEDDQRRVPIPSIPSKDGLFNVDVTVRV